jgi:hypothetical protein
MSKFPGKLIEVSNHWMYMNSVLHWKQLPYIDYGCMGRAKFGGSFWNAINRDKVAKRLVAAGKR